MCTSKFIYEYVYIRFGECSGASCCAGLSWPVTQSQSYGNCDRGAGGVSISGLAVIGFHEINSEVFAIDMPIKAHKNLI